MPLRYRMLLCLVLACPTQLCSAQPYLASGRPVRIANFRQVSGDGFSHRSSGWLQGQIAWMRGDSLQLSTGGTAATRLVLVDGETRFVPMPASATDPAGRLVRIVARGPRGGAREGSAVLGLLGGLDSDAVWVVGRKGKGAAIPATAIESVHLAERGVGGTLRRGVMIGAGVGLGLGLLAAGPANPGPVLGMTAVGALLFGPLGVLYEALKGAEWMEVSLTQLRVTVP